MTANRKLKQKARTLAAEQSIRYPAALESAAATAQIPKAAATLVPGDRVRFTPTHGSGNRWWTLRARSDRFLVLTQQAPFAAKGELWYTVVDLTGWDHTYNGVGPGVVRSSLNSLGGGWDCREDEDCQQIVADLEAGKWHLSPRRVAAVGGIEVRAS